MLTSSAETGFAAGESALADLFREGKGTQPDMGKAKNWADQAAHSRDEELWREIPGGESGSRA